MAYVIPPGYAQIVWRMFSGNGDGEINVQMGYATGGTIDQITADSASDYWATEIAERMNTGIRYIGCKITVGNDGDNIIYESSEGAPADGARGGNPWPLNCAALVRKVTALGGRSNRGRMYLPGGVVGDFEGGGLLSSDGITWVGALYSAILGSEGLEAVNGDNWVVLHTEGVGGVPTPITTFTLEPKLASQRGRLR